MYAPNNIYVIGLYSPYLFLFYFSYFFSSLFMSPSLPKIKVSRQSNRQDWNSEIFQLFVASSIFLVVWVSFKKKKKIFSSSKIFFFFFCVEKAWSSNAAGLTVQSLLRGNGCDCTGSRISNIHAQIPKSNLTGLG